MRWGKRERERELHAWADRDGRMAMAKMRADWHLIEMGHCPIEGKFLQK